MKKTKTLLAALALLILSFPARAESPCKQQPIEDLAKAIAKAYEAKTLGSLDAQKPFAGKVRVVIEHSLADDTDKDRFVVKWFNSLAKADSWLKGREHEEMPARGTRPLAKCAKGVCSFDLDGGILHNNLYLKKITYGMRAGCPYVKTIYLLDGD